MSIKMEQSQKCSNLLPNRISELHSFSILLPFNVLLLPHYTGKRYRHRCRSCSCTPPLEVTGSKVDGTSKKRVGVIVASHAVHTCIFGDAFCGRYQGHLQRFFETFQDEWFRVNSACFDPTA